MKLWIVVFFTFLKVDLSFAGDSLEQLSDRFCRNVKKVCNSVLCKTKPVADTILLELVFSRLQKDGAEILESYKKPMPTAGPELAELESTIIAQLGPIRAKSADLGKQLEELVNALAAKRNQVARIKETLVRILKLDRNSVFNYVLNKDVTELFSQLKSLSNDIFENSEKLKLVEFERQETLEVLSERELNFLRTTNRALELRAKLEGEQLNTARKNDEKMSQVFFEPLRAHLWGLDLVRKSMQSENTVADFFVGEANQSLIREKNLTDFSRFLHHFLESETRFRMTTTGFRNRNGDDVILAFSSSRTFYHLKFFQGKVIEGLDAPLVDAIFIPKYGYEGAFLGFQVLRIQGNVFEFNHDDYSNSSRGVDVDYDFRQYWTNMPIRFEFEDTGITPRIEERIDRYRTQINFFESPPPRKSSVASKFDKMVEKFRQDLRDVSNRTRRSR